MNAIRRSALAVLALSIALVCGCTVSSRAAPTPRPTAPAPAVFDLQNTLWAGQDSEGETATFTFEPKGVLTGQYGAVELSDADDRWSVDGDKVSLTVALSSGIRTLSGVLDDQPTAITLEGKDASGATVTLVVERKLGA